MIIANTVRRISKNTGMSVYTLAALLFVILSALWLTYRNFESVINPVVIDFEVTHVEHHADSTLIWGELDKVRGCVFKGLVAYSGTRLLDVNFLKDGRTVSREPRYQLFGPWLVRPRADKIEIFTRHECDTGSVVSRIYNNSLGPDNKSIVNIPVLGDK